ncbi:PEP-utilizing enzyme [Patescibacteria group bacterium]
MKSVIGYAYREIIILFKENIFYVFIDQKDHERVGHAVLNKVYKKPDLFVHLAKKQKAFAKSFYSFLKKNNNPIGLKTISNGTLAELHEEYERRYKQVYSHYFPILAIEIYFFEYLNEYISSKENDSVKAAQHINILITERKAMVNRQERIAALTLCKRIQKNKKLLNYFKSKSNEDVIEKVKGDKALHALLRKHEKDYFWITRDYEDPVLTLEDFIIRFKKHLCGNPSSALAKLDAEEEKLRSDIKNISKKLKIDSKHQRLFQTMREGIYYKELRKSIVSQSLYYYDPILGEIARRAGLSLRQARHLLTREVRPMLTKGLDMSDKLNERIRLSAFHVIRGKTTVHTGKNAQQYFNHLVKVDKNVKRLEGMPVSPGKAKGPVKIVINPDAFHKVKKGDIIATLQATPVFTRVLSIASGLICDGGPGITSHPATLAREAGIPGIIGLRMTTKILKDGQIVEIDGDKGTVKIE